MQMALILSAVGVMHHEKEMLTGKKLKNRLAERDNTHTPES